MSVINLQYPILCFDWGPCTPSWFGVGVDIRWSEWYDRWCVTHCIQNSAPLSLYLSLLSAELYSTVFHWSESSGTAEWSATGCRDPDPLQARSHLIWFCSLRIQVKSQYPPVLWDSELKCTIYIRKPEEDATPSVLEDSNRGQFGRGSPRACPIWITI